MIKHEIEAKNMREAMKKAKDLGVVVTKNFTEAFLNSKPSDFDKWAEERLNERTIILNNNVAPVGIVELDTPVLADKRKNNFALQDYKMEGQLTKTRVFEIRRKSDSAVVADASTKANAIKQAKKLMKSGACKEDLYCVQVYRVDDAHRRVFDILYTPQAEETLGRYIVFSK